jgi:carboxylesterase type B
MPKTPLPEMLDAIRENSVCPQIEMDPEVTIVDGKEDCLYLNIYSTYVCI